MFCSESLKKTREHHLFDDFRPLRDWEKSFRGNNNNNNNNNTNTNTNTNNQQPTTNNQQPTTNNNNNSNSNSNSTVVFGLWGAKNMEMSGVFTPCGALRASPTSSTTQRQQAFEFGFFCSLFLRFCCGDAFCTDTLLQTDDVTYRNLYTEQLLCADTYIYIYTLTQRGLCDFTRRRLYTQRLLHKEVLHTQVLYTDALHKGAFTRINKRTQALLHTEPFTQRNLCTEQFLHKKELHRKGLIPKNLPTQTAQKKTPKLLRAETLPRATFTHRNFSAQKPLRTEVFMHSSFYTGPFTHRCLYTENFYTQNLLHTAHFYTQPAFTRRGFASPSWSPAFRVPRLKCKLEATLPRCYVVPGIIPIIFRQSEPAKKRGMKPSIIIW